MSDNIRYNLRLPTNLHDQIKAIAERDGITKLEVITRFIKIGLWIDEKITDDYDLTLVKDDKQEKVIFL